MIFSLLSAILALISVKIIVNVNFASKFFDEMRERFFCFGISLMPQCTMRLNFINDVLYFDGAFYLLAWSSKDSMDSTDVVAAPCLC